MTTLQSIRTKVRRITASPSAIQLTDNQIDDYVNTFYLFDLPSHLKIFDLKETYTFYTEPNVDTYALIVDPSMTATTPRAYYSVTPPVYVAGYESYYTQSRTEFYRMYPSINVEDYIAGDGGAGAYAITIDNTPVLRSQVTVSATDAGGNRLIAFDDGLGGFDGDVTAGAIDYETGEITALMFTANIPVTENITVQSIPYVASRPSCVLFDDNEFTVRPVPDKTYRVDLNAYVYPTVLLNAGDSPEVHYLWQLLAIGASKKVYEDRGDMEGVQSLGEMFNEQMILCQRRTLEQNRPVRAATIYTSSLGGSGNLNYNH